MLYSLSILNRNKCLLTLISLRQLFIYAVLIALPVTAHTASSTLKVLIAYQKPPELSRDTPQGQGFSQQLIKNLKKNIDKAGFKAHPLMLDLDNVNTHRFNDYALIIAVGSNITKILLNKKIGTAIFSVLMPRHLTAQLRKRYPEKKNWSSLLIDQPIDRQFYLISSITGKPQKTGVLISPYTKKLKKTLKKSAKKSNHTLTTKYVANTEELTASLKSLAKKSTILLTLPDPVIYNKNTIRGILLLSYRNKLPVIGFSKAYVKAGAIAAIYSQPNQISKQTISIIKRFFKRHFFKRNEYYPKYFSVALNKKVATSLGIDLPEKSVVITKIKKAEKRK